MLFCSMKTNWGYYHKKKRFVFLYRWHFFLAASSPRQSHSIWVMTCRYIFTAVLRIRIHLFLGLLDPDPPVFGSPGSWFGPISQRHGSADLGPDPHQNVTDLQHWFVVKIIWRQNTVIWSKNIWLYIFCLGMKALAMNLGHTPSQRLVQNCLCRMSAPRFRKSWQSHAGQCWVDFTSYQNQYSELIRKQDLFFVRPFFGSLI